MSNEPKGMLHPPVAVIIEQRPEGGVIIAEGTREPEGVRLTRFYQSTPEGGTRRIVPTEEQRRKVTIPTQTPTAPPPGAVIYDPGTFYAIYAHPGTRFKGKLGTYAKPVIPSGAYVKRAYEKPDNPATTKFDPELILEFGSYAYDENVAESVSFFKSIGFPKFGGKLSPFEIPAGAYVKDIVEFPDNPATPEDESQFQVIFSTPAQDQAEAESISFYEGIGYSQFAGRYAPIEIPEGFKLISLTEVSDDLATPDINEARLEAQFESLVAQESREFYTSIGYPQFGGKYAPIEIPAGHKLVSLTEVPDNPATPENEAQLEAQFESLTPQFTYSPEEQAFYGMQMMGLRLSFLTAGARAWSQTMNQQYAATPSPQQQAAYKKISQAFGVFTETLGVMAMGSAGYIVKDVSTVTAPKWLPESLYKPTQTVITFEPAPAPPTPSGFEQIAQQPSGFLLPGIVSGPTRQLAQGIVGAEQIRKDPIGYITSKVLEIGGTAVALIAPATAIKGAVIGLGLQQGIVGITEQRLLTPQEIVFTASISATFSVVTPALTSAALKAAGMKIVAGMFGPAVSTAKALGIPAGAKVLAVELGVAAGIGGGSSYLLSGGSLEAAWKGAAFAAGITLGVEAASLIAPYVPTIKYGKVEIPLEGGGKVTWRGLYISRGSEAPYILGRWSGDIPEGGLILSHGISGEATGWIPQSNIEAAVTTRLMGKLGYSPEVVADVTGVRSLMGSTQNVKSKYIEEMLPKETRSLSEQGVSTVKEFVLSHAQDVDELYGSFATKPQLSKEFEFLSAEGVSALRTPADIDIQLTVGLPEAQKFSSNLLKALLKAGETVRISPESPMLIESFTGKGWMHAVDIHYIGEPVDVLTPTTGKAWGFNLNKPNVQIENIRVMGAGEQGLRKGASLIGFTSEGTVSPVAHRIKDIPDFFQIQKTLFSSKTLGMTGTEQVTFTRLMARFGVTEQTLLAAPFTFESYSVSSTAAPASPAQIISPIIGTFGYASKTIVSPPKTLSVAILPSMKTSVSTPTKKVTSPSYMPSYVTSPSISLPISYNILPSVSSPKSIQLPSLPSISIGVSSISSLETYPSYSLKSLSISPSKLLSTPTTASILKSILHGYSLKSPPTSYPPASGKSTPIYPSTITSPPIKSPPTVSLPKEFDDLRRFLKRDIKPPHGYGRYPRQYPIMTGEQMLREVVATTPRRRR